LISRNSLGVIKGVPMSAANMMPPNKHAGRQTVLIRTRQQKGRDEADLQRIQQIINKQCLCGQLWLIVCRVKGMVWVGFWS
jgi:hypothetical protein